MRMNREQMTAIAKHLADSGYGVMFEESEDEGEYDDQGNPPMWRTVVWGTWTIYETGELNIDGEDFPLNDCGLVAFIQAAHKAIHAVGGEVISQ